MHVQARLHVQAREVLTDAEVARVSVCLFWSFFPRESGMMVSQHGEAGCFIWSMARKKDVLCPALPGLEIHLVRY